jgi:hypothetical protein
MPASARVEVGDKPTVTPESTSGPANSQLLPGLRPGGDLAKETQEVLDDNGRVIKNEKGQGAQDSTSGSQNDDPGVDVNGQSKPESDKNQKSDSGDLW